MTNLNFGGVTGGTLSVLTSTQIGIVGNNGTTYLANGTGITYSIDGDGFVTFTGGTITSVTINSVMTITGFSMSISVFFDVLTLEGFAFITTFLGGNDTITGTGNNDILFGYTGNDTINGGGGNDTIIADAGNDTIDGGPGTDLLTFADFSAPIRIDLSLSTAQTFGPGLGSDTILSIENVEGTDFADTFTAGTGVHTIWGFGGADTFYAKVGGIITFHGGDGADIFHLESSSTVTARGGAGDDIFYLGGSLTAADVIDGDYLHFGLNEGFDTLYLDGDYSSFRNLSSSVAGVEFIHLAGGNSYDLEFGQWGSLEATIDGSALSAAHSLNISGHFVTIIAGAGDDVLTIKPDAWYGTDFYLELGGIDVAIGGDGRDNFYFGASLTSDDFIDGGDSNNHSIDNTLWLDGDYSAGVTLHAANIEYIRLASGHSYKLILGEQFSGADYPHVDASTLGAGDFIYLDLWDAEVSFLTVQGGAGNDTVLVDRANVHGGDGDDFIQALTGNEFYGEGGNDTLIGGSDFSILDGGEGDDLLVSGGGTTRMSGGGGEMRYYWNNDRTIVYFDLNGDAEEDRLLILGGYVDLAETAPGSNIFASVPDSNPPLVVSIREHESENVVLNAKLRINFNEEVLLGSGDFQIWNEDGSLFTTIAADGGQVTVSGPSIFVNPTPNFVDGSAYYVTIDPGAITDLAGNAFAGISSPDDFHFTAQIPDTTPPALLSTSPSDGSTTVARNADIVLTFDEQVVAGDWDIELRHSGTHAQLVEISIHDTSQVTFSGSTMTINPAQDLLPDTTYYLFIGASGTITDIAGNPFPSLNSGNSFAFTTAPFSTGDTARPVLLGTSPADDAGAVNPAANIQLTFNESVRAGEGHVVIRRSSNGSIAYAFDLSDSPYVTFSENIITLNPAGDLLQNTNYYVTIEYGAILDTAGNAFAGFSSTGPFNFTTGGAGPDVTAPQLIGTYPADGATDAWIGSDLALTFNETVIAGAGDIEIRRSADGSLVERMDVTDPFRVRISGTLVLIDPGVPFEDGTSYYVVFGPGVITDLAGNPFAGLQSSTAFNFQADASSGDPDFEAPLLSFVVPDNALDVSVDAVLQLHYNDGMNIGTGTVEIRRNADDSLFAAIDVSDASQVSVFESVVLIDPTQNFEAGVDYYISFAAGAFTDLSGNAASGITGSVFNFRTQTAGSDTTAPTVVRFLPPDGSSNADTNFGIAIQFNEAIKAGTGKVEIRRSSDNSLAKSFDLNDIYDTTIDNDYLHLSSKLFAPGTSYYLVIEDGAILDQSNNPFAGITSPTTFNFTTGGNATAPWITGFSPSENERNVAVGSNIVLTFSETIVAGTGEIKLHWSGPYFETFDIDDASQVSIVGNQLIINPTADLLPGTYYTLSMPDGTVTDLSGNGFYGIDAPAAYGFVTDLGSADSGAPLLSSAAPTDNETEVAVDANIILTFNEAIRQGRGYFEFRKTSDNSLFTSISVFDDVQVLISESTVTINPVTDFLPNTGYYLVFNSGVLEDFSDNPFSGIASPTGLNFQTGNDDGGKLIDFEHAPPSSYMGGIRDFDGNNLGGLNGWEIIGEIDIQGDGDLEFIFVNDEIGRWASVGPAEDGLVYFDNHSWGGDTRVVGIYIDPLVEAGVVERFGPFDSQQRFQNDLIIGNIASVLGAGDFDGDGLQEVYFGIADQTAYLHAYMHADGNIRYANYQNEEQMIDFLEGFGFGEETYGDWLYGGGSAAFVINASAPASLEAPQFFSRTIGALFAAS